MPGKHYLEAELDHLIKTDEATWKFIQSGSLDGVWYWDLEKPDNEWMSEELWRTLGFDPADRRHDPAEWQDLIFKEDLDLAMENFNAHCADPEHPYDQIVRYRHANGSTVWIRCRGKAIRDETGKPIRMLGAHTDITAVKQSEESARAAWRATEAANEEMRTFAYAISHDMKAPANTMNLLLDEFAHLTEGTLDPDATDVLEMSRQTIRRMLRLVEDVLDYTRVIGSEPKFERMCLNDAAEVAMDNLKADIQAREAAIDVAPLPDVHAVRTQMNILFQNLISNSIKYCDAETRPDIQIGWQEEQANGRFRVTFRDNGIGIRPEAQARIFRMFQRLHGHDEIQGTGIGLSLCQRIALNHHGELNVFSRPGAGSEFSLSIPWNIQ